MRNRDEGGVVIEDAIEKVVNAVLYEGYILYPYRASSKKNQVERFTFGRVYPRDYSRAEQEAEPWLMQTECLVRNESRDAFLESRVRFLQPTARQVGRLRKPVSELSDDIEFEIVPELTVNGQVYRSWIEAIERGISIEPLRLDHATRREQSLHFPANRSMEAIRDGSEVIGVLVRTQEAINGTVAIRTSAGDDTTMKISVKIMNESRIDQAAMSNRDAIIRRTFASTHMILSVVGGEFISLLDPPAAYQEMAQACRNIGCWPVLVGDETRRETMLSAPIILYDYPRVADESVGDLFDSTEIDEILALRIQTLTDEEKSEMRSVDEHARRLLERVEGISGDGLMRMHGTMKRINSVDESFFNPGKKIERAKIGQINVQRGDRVRIRPKRRADIMDMALEGKIAIIEAIEQDLEDRVHFALILEEDPGRDLGLMRQPGHRFFYDLDEVEPVVDS